MRFLLCFVAGIAVTAGCQGLPTPRVLSLKPRLADREGVAKALPKGHTLDQVIGADSKTVDNDGKCRYSNPVTLEEKLAGQKQVRALENQRNASRRSLFDAQDEIDRRRAAFIAEIEGKLAQRVELKPLFSIEWTLA